MTISNVTSTGQSILTALNSSGGIDYSTLATNLANATELPYQQIIQNKITADNAQITSVGKVMSSVSAFQQSLTALGDPSLLQSSPVSSDTTKIAVSTITGASVSPNLNATVNVEQLSSASTVTLSGISSASTPLISSGSQQINFTDPSGLALNDANGQPISLTIDSSTTLSGLNDQINKLNGFSSQIVQGGSAQSPLYYLEIQHGTGQASQFAINFGASTSAPINATKTTVGGVSTSEVQTLGLGSSLSAGAVYQVTIPTLSGSTITKSVLATTGNAADFATALQAAFSDDTADNLNFSSSNGSISIQYGASGSVNGTVSVSPATTTSSGSLAISNVQEGQDAKISVDGVEATSATNNFSGVIPGLQLTVLATTQNASGQDVPVTLSSSYNTQNLTTAVSTLVTGFNSLLQTLATETKYNSDPTQAGALDSNTSAKDLITQLRNFTTTPLKGSSSQDVYFSQLGISTNSDGTLSLDTTAFSNLLSTNPSLVASVLGSMKSTDTNGVTIGSVSSSTVPGYYQLQKNADGWYLGGSKALQMPGAIEGATGSSVDGMVINMSTADQNNAAVGFTAQISYSQGMVERFTNLMSSLSQSTSSINQITTQAQADITTQNTNQANLDTKTTQQQQRYLNQFAALNTYLMNAQDTQSNLTNMMSAWSSVLKQ